MSEKVVSEMNEFESLLSHSVCMESLSSLSELSAIDTYGFDN